MTNKNDFEDTLVSLNVSLAEYYSTILEEARSVQELARESFLGGKIDRDKYESIIRCSQIPATVLSAMQTYLKDNRASIDASDAPRELTEYSRSLEKSKREIEGRLVEQLPLTEDDDG